MAIHTEYSVRVNSAYPPTTRRSAPLPTSAPKTPRRPRLVTADHLMARRRTLTGPIPHAPQGPHRWASRPPAGGHRVARLWRPPPRPTVRAAVPMGSVCGIRTQLDMEERLLLAPAALTSRQPQVRPRVLPGLGGLPV